MGTGGPLTKPFEVAPATAKAWRSSPLVIAALALILVHGGLLAASIPDYRVTIDSAYHVSMARAYGEHGLVPWDHINFGPRGRPNLQGPLMYAAIGGVGRLLGGGGDDYVLANAILAVLQWFAAMATTAFFAWQLGGELALLCAVALLSGAAFADTSFAVGIPSGWLFIFTPWAIWFFVRERLLAAAAAASAAIYVHLGGYFTAPVGILFAAMLTRRWRQLLLCGVLIAAITMPYTVHVVRHLDWLSGEHSHSALLFDPLLDLLAVAGLLRILWRPREHPFMLAWLLAPIAWLFQDPGRFLLQWPLGGSVAAGLLVAECLGRIVDRRSWMWCTAAFVALATLLPLGIPSLAAEISWVAGNHYPRPVDWRAAQTLAATIERSGLGGHLVAYYNPALCPALAVYAPITCDKGHWIEVQPPHDPADQLSAVAKVYVLPLDPTDSLLGSMAERGWLKVEGGDRDAAVVRLTRRPPLNQAAAVASGIIATEAGWLGRNAINNSMTFRDWRRAISATRMRQFRRELTRQRAHAGGLELAWLVYAWALEAENPAQASEARRVARGMGMLASYLSDGLALDFIAPHQFVRLQKDLLDLAAQSNGRAIARPAPDLLATPALCDMGRLFRRVLWLRDVACACHSASISF